MTTGRPRTRDTDPFARLSRYDFVLLAIPVAFAAAIALRTAGVVPGRTAILAASTVGLLSLVDALFVNPPGTRPGR